MELSPYPKPFARSTIHFRVGGAQQVEQDKPPCGTWIQHEMDGRPGFLCTTCHIWLPDGVPFDCECEGGESLT